MLRTSERYYRFSARLARRAVVRARGASTTAAAALVIAQHQAAEASEVAAATTAMLAEQGHRVPPEASLVPLAFTTGASELAAMMAQIETDWQFDRLVTSLVQDAGRAAQLTDVATRPRVRHVRHLNLPSCSRCAVLAGRVYRYSEGFQRHPGCDCVMIPTTVANPDLVYNPEQLARDGLVTGLSKVDLEAIDMGADFNQVVNVRMKRARKNGGLSDSGDVLRRGNRPTPAGILRTAGGDRDRALDLLTKHGYIR